ncbi:MAG: hypothetical protein Q6356_003270 [Candidatus Wukongarchaeota archaeon]|nr:hypothetical protein [Candidatus Wukongarchaeota archaeon]
MFQEFLDGAAAYLGTTATNTGILLSIIIIFALLFIVAIATEGQKFEIVGTITFLLFTVFFTGIEWLPVWTGAVMGLGVAILAAYYISKMGST